MAATNAKLKNFETNYATLEKLVQNLESPDLTLAQSLELFEKSDQSVPVLRKCAGICPAAGSGPGRHAERAGYRYALTEEGLSTYDDTGLFTG